MGMSLAAEGSGLDAKGKGFFLILDGAEYSVEGLSSLTSFSSSEDSLLRFGDGRGKSPSSRSLSSALEDAEESLREGAITIPLTKCLVS